MRNFSGDTTAIISWPSERPEVADEDKIDAAKWRIAIRVLNYSYTREAFERSSPAETKRGVEWEAFDLISFAERTPTVTAAYGVGSCLFLAGYAPKDWGDGTALTWIAVDVRRPGVAGVFRIPPPDGKPLPLDRKGAAVRAFDEQFVYSVYRDGDGVFFVQRHRLPKMDC